MLSLSDLFKKLRAPLNNPRWSWGAVSEEGIVILRVWGDQRENINGKLFVRVTHHKRFEDDPENFGYKERLKHVALIGDGARSYCIQCVAKDPSAIRMVFSYGRAPRALELAASARSWAQHGIDSVRRG